MTIVPNAKHKPGEKAKVFYDPKRTKGPNDPDRLETGEIPQVAETYAFLNAAYPIMNEHQLAIGETTIGSRRELMSENGIIDAPELYRLVLERAKTAREAIRALYAAGAKLDSGLRRSRARWPQPRAAHGHNRRAYPRL